MIRGDGSSAKPVVYSVGVDRTDDGGTLPARPELDAYLFHFKTPGQVKNWLADPRTAVSIRGDWILYDPAKVAGRLSDPTAAAPDRPASSSGTK